MATAKKTPSGKWRVLAYVGKNVTKSGYKSFTASTKKEAERMAAAFIPPAPGKERLNITVGEAIDRYIEVRSAVLSPSTIDGYLSLRNTMFPALMPVSVSMLTQQQVQQAVNASTISGKSPKTIRNAHGLLAAVLSELRPDLHLNTVMPQRQKPGIKIPTEEEISQLIKAACPEMQAAILIAAQMGLRRGEICALTVGDCDFEHNLLRVNKSIVYTPDNRWEIKAPKSEAGYRTLEMTAGVSRLLNSFSGSGPLLGLNPNMVTRRFQRLQEKCFGQVRFRFHDLRHYNASVMLSLGVPNKYAMERMGHATDNMLKSVYQHTMRSKQQEIARKMTDYFDKHTTQNTTQK